MPLSKEEKKKKLKERKDAYYSTANLVNNMKWKLKEIEKNRGHTIAFRQLMLSLDGYEQQVSDDFSRYEKRILRCDNKHDVVDMQKALNRERTLREGLEKKIKEASESSGLFIKFVRNKLGV